MEGLFAQSVERESDRQAHEGLAHRFQLVNQGSSLRELAPGRMIFEFRGQISGYGGKRCHHPRHFMSGLAESSGVLIPEGVLDRRQLIGQAFPKGLTNLLEDASIAAAGRQ
jgi:hypothetical protein